MSLKANRNQGTLEARLESLLVSSQFSDCSFLVGNNEKPEVFFAHRILLASCSPVFEAMFFGPLAETQQVCIPDVDQNGFRVMLKYVYTGRAKFKGVEEACSVFYASQKYLITDLSDICKAYILQEMNTASAAAVYKLAQTFQDEELYDACLEEMRRNFSRVIRGDTQHLSPAILVDLLSADILNDTEFTLFETLGIWTAKECFKRGIPDNGTNCRLVLEECGIWPHLRPLTLKANQFLQLAHIGLFSPQEVDSLKAYFSKRDLEESRYDEEKVSLPDTINSTLTTRRPTPIRAQICERRRLKAGPPASGPLTTTVSLLVSRPVQLRAVRVPSRLCPAILAANKHCQMYEESLELVIRDKTGFAIARKKHTAQVCYNTDMTIDLQEPLHLEEGCTLYIVSVEIGSQNAEYPTYCLSSKEKVKNVVFSFIDQNNFMPPTRRHNSYSFPTRGSITGLTFTL